MIGRAGRPGFDTSGTAVIMTDNKSKATFQTLASSGLGIAKSQLNLKLDEIVNTEVSQRVITSMESAVNWMKGTLYYGQLRHTPRLLEASHQAEDAWDSHLTQMCQQSITRLREIGALAVRSSGCAIHPLP